MLDVSAGGLFTCDKFNLNFAGRLQSTVRSLILNLFVYKFFARSCVRLHKHVLAHA